MRKVPTARLKKNHSKEANRNGTLISLQMRVLSPDRVETLIVHGHRLGYRLGSGTESHRYKTGFEHTGFETPSGHLGDVK